MRCPLAWMVLGLVLGWFPAPLGWGQGGTRTGTDATADVPDPGYGHRPEAAPATPRARSRVTLSREPRGKLILSVDYPWKVHAKPSVEVRLLGEGEPDDLAVQPMYFRWKYMKGKTTLAVYRCQDECENVPTSVPVKEGGVEYEVLGDRNSLGTPSVCVARQVVRKEATERSGPVMQPGAAAAFPLLDHWAVGRGQLWLDLPEDYFAEPGRMRVWFLRDDRVVWSEDVSWPGLGTPGAKKPAPAKAAPAKKPPAKPRPVAVPKPRPRPQPSAKPKREPRPKAAPNARPKREPKPKRQRPPRTKKSPKKKDADELGF